MLNPFSSKYKTYHLRKKYDRLREKADKLSRTERFQILKVLDSVSNYIVQLEEQDVPMSQKRRMTNSIQRALKQAKLLLKTHGQMRPPTGVTRDRR